MVVEHGLDPLDQKLMESKDLSDWLIFTKVIATSMKFTTLHLSQS